LANTSVSATWARCPPRGSNDLRRVLIRDQADRDAIASQLIRYRDERGGAWADIIDMMTMNREVRRKVVRLLAEIAAEGRS
jgi:hypothetical protein